MDEIAADVAAVDGQVTGDVRIGILGTTARWLLPHLLTALDEPPPERAGDRLRGQHVGAHPGLLTGRVSARAIIHLPVDDPELVIEPLFAEDLVVVAHAEHPLAGARRAAARRGRRRTACCCRRPARRCAGCSTGPPATVGVQLRAQAEIDGVRLLASLAADGHGAAIVPATAVPQSATGRFGVVRVPELPPRVVALAHQRRPGAERADPRPVRGAARGRRRPAPASSPACASARARSRSAGRSDRLRPAWPRA